MAVSLAALFAGNAHAQSAPPATPSNNDTPVVDNTAATRNTGDIIVTARKRSESLVKVPTSITAFGASTIAKFNIQNFSDYAAKVPNLSFNNGGGAASTGGATQTTTIQIRGVSGINTTGFYIDDTPVPSTIDPRVVDLQRIEVLKGPQGTLFGASSMGGNVRLITNQPDFSGNSGSAMLQGGGTSHGGSADYGGNAIVNIVAVPDRIAVRAMAFDQHDAGFLTNTYPSANGNATLSRGNQDQITTYGGAVSATFKFSDKFQLAFKVIGQEKRYQGLPEAYAPLPEFTPVYTLNRTARVDESAYDRFILAAMVAKYEGAGFTITSSTSYFYNNSYENENGTEGTYEFFAANEGVDFNPANGFSASQHEFQKSITEEARITFDPWRGLSEVLGVYYSHDSNIYDFPAQNIAGLAASGLYSSDLVIVGQETAPRDSTAAFGEAYYKFLNAFTLTLGGRLFFLQQSFHEVADGFYFGGPFDGGVIRSRQTGFSPKAALSYSVTRDANLYALYSKGFRPGAPQPPLPDACQAGAAALGIDAAAYKSDTVDNFEIGAKSSLFGGRAYVSAAAFQINWNNIQQTVFLPCDSTITANTGQARIRGGEWEFNGQVFKGFDIRAGLGFESAIITNPGSSPLAAGERVFQVPKLNATFGFNYTREVTGKYQPFISMDYSYVGNRLSGTSSESSPLLEPAYSLVNARVGVAFGRSTLSIYGNNLFDTKANTGDIQQISFNQTIVNSAGQTIAYPRVGVLHPRAVGLQFKHGF